MKRLEEIFDTTISDYNKRVSHVYAFEFTDSERYNIKEVTHYQPIEVPKPPIF